MLMRKGEARGATVGIERLHFIRPKLYTIVVDEVSGLTIESCVIENVEPTPPSGDMISLIPASEGLLTEEIDCIVPYAIQHKSRGVRLCARI